jgi:hypothetical protein
MYLVNYSSSSSSSAINVEMLFTFLLQKHGSYNYSSYHLLKLTPAFIPPCFLSLVLLNPF